MYQRKGGKGGKGGKKRKKKPKEPQTKWRYSLSGSAKAGSEIFLRIWSFRVGLSLKVISFY